ncbi:MAG: domain S-box [Candidatus Saccharibacteria bacterium]|nr:domain S-box [Candidatus Saccharibacteria bacterium]
MLRYITQYLKKPKHIVEIVFIGTFTVTFCLTISLILSIFLLNNQYVQNRLFIAIALILYLILIKLLISKSRIKLAAWSLLALYSFVGLFTLLQWSINAPVGILVLAFVIFLSAILLGSKYIFPVTICVILLIIFVQIIHSLNVIEPDRSSLAIESGFGDVASYSIIFCIFALIAWIAGNQVEKSLTRAQNAESTLENEKELLEITLNERTKLLHESQVKEMGQLYHFAELGQLTTVVMHELANYVSVLSLDIDELKYSNKRSKSLSRVEESLKYLDIMIDQVRKQIKESGIPVKFNAYKQLKEVKESLRDKSKENGVSILIKRPIGTKVVYVFGDPVRFSHIILILINNAIDSYKTNPNGNNEIEVHLNFDLRDVSISIIDFGIGINAEKRKQLFKPGESNKIDGSGMGLYLAKQIVETHFKGNLSISPSFTKTEFIITLPLASSPLPRHNNP